MLSIESPLPTMESAAASENGGTIERLFSRDVASEIPGEMPVIEAVTHDSFNAGFGSPLDRVFSRDATDELALHEIDATLAPPLLERLFSRDVADDLPAEGVSMTSQQAMTPFERVLMAADNDSTQQSAATQTTPDRNGTMSPTSILDNDGESPEGTEGETPATVSVSELEALVFSPSGPREGIAPIPEGPRGMEHFRTALDAHVRPSPRSLDPQMLARRDRYEAALLDLNSQFKARWLDFDQSVAMAEPHSYSHEAALTPGRTPTEHTEPENASMSTPVRASRSSLNSRAPPSPLLVASHTFDPVLNCPTPPGALTAPASPPLSAEELSAYLASLGITIAAEKALILVAGYQEEANEGQPRVQMQRLRKDMRVAVARSLRPVPSPRGSFVGQNAAAAGSPGGTTEGTDALTAALDALPLPSLALVNTRISSAASLSKNKSPPGGMSTSGLSEESPCIWSPKVGTQSRPLGATPPAIVETGEDESSQHGGQALT